mgnify:CR=1 FL=1
MADSFFFFPGPMGQPIRRLQNNMHHVPGNSFAMRGMPRMGQRAEEGPLTTTLCHRQGQAHVTYSLDTRIVEPIESENR